MQDEAAERAQYHNAEQISNGPRTSNVTSSPSPGGQQQQSWMLPGQAASSKEQDRSPDILATQARQMKRIVQAPVNNRTSQDYINTATPHVQARPRDASRTSEGSPYGRHHGIVQQNSIQIPTTKRPRLDAQHQRPLATHVESQGIPLYSFVSSPVQTTYAPTVHDFAISSPLSTSTTSPQIAAEPVNIYQGPATTQSLMPRRQSVLTNMSVPSNRIPGVHSEMRQQHSAQASPTTDTSSVRHALAQQPAITKRKLSLVYLPRLQAAISDPQTKDAFRDWALQRVVLLEEACKSEDWFYLTLHQIYCWRTLDRAVMPQLGISGKREVQLANLDAVLLPNTKLQYSALEWFSQFPTHQKDLLQGSNSDAVNALKLTHTFLDRMGMHWSQVSSSCLARKYPPSPYELYERLGMSSTVLQTVFFTFIFRQIEGGDDRGWVNRATRFVSPPAPRFLTLKPYHYILLPSSPSYM